MRNHSLYLLNLFISLFTAALIFTHLPTPTGKAVAPKGQPGAAAIPFSLYHLSYPFER